MADNDIIDFYKKADTDSKPEEPLKEQVETPEPVVSEAVAVPVPESNDPFDKFLFNLAEKLKTEKKITEQQQLKFNERVVKPTTKTSTAANIEDIKIHFHLEPTTRTKIMGSKN